MRRTAATELEEARRWHSEHRGRLREREEAVNRQEETLEVQEGALQDREGALRVRESAVDAAEGRVAQDRREQSDRGSKEDLAANDRRQQLRAMENRLKEREDALQRAERDVETKHAKAEAALVKAAATADRMMTAVGKGKKENTDADGAAAEQPISRATSISGGRSDDESPCGDDWDEASQHLGGIDGEGGALADKAARAQL